MKRAQKTKGSVVKNKARRTWNLLYFGAATGKRTSRKLGTLAELTEEDALRKAEAVRRELRLVTELIIVTVIQLVEWYRAEKMPRRADTRRSYEVWLNYIIERFGNVGLYEVQARLVELWLASLPLAPKSKVHIRGMLRILWDFAMWCGAVPVQRNPMELVTIKGATKRTKKPRSLTAVEFQKFVQHLAEPFRTIALLCVCFGLRISEALALKWRDVDWLNGKLTIERGIVCQIVDEVKTPESQRSLHVDSEMLGVLRRWKQASQFSAPEDWIFASPVQYGRLPWSYDQVWRVYQKAAGEAGIGRLGTHALRHTYRSWLDAVGTPLAVQQKLMRHADIRTTMNIYGDVVTDEMEQAQSKVVRMALARVH